MATATAGFSTPDLARFGRELDAVRREAAALTDGLTDAQLAWRAEAGRWSAGEVVSHLQTLNSRYLEAIDRSIADARSHGRSGFAGYKPGLIGGFMVRMMEPPVRRRLKTPAIFRPKAGEGVSDDWRGELAGYLATHDAIEERLHAASHVSLTEARVVSPGSRFLRMNLGDAFALLLAHERRHLAQLRQLRTDPAFPG